MANEGKLMEPGLGTNPRSSGERCRLRVATRSRTTPDAGLPWAKRKRAKLEVSQWHPAGFEPVADATDPYRTSRIPTPQGGWVGFCELQRRNGAGACLSQCLPPPSPPAGAGGGRRGGRPCLTEWRRVQRIRHYVAYSPRHPEPRPHIC